MEFYKGGVRLALTYNIYRDKVKVSSNLIEKSYTDRNLTPNTTYEYQISSENSFGESQLSKIVTVTTDYSPVEDVTLNKGELELDIGDSDSLSAIVSPSTAKQDVEWVSDDSSIATVDSNGNVEAIAEGETFITVSSESDPGLEDACSVIVIDSDPEPEN